MKEMIYSNQEVEILLHSGTYKDHKFAILNLGTHPTAYVENKLKGVNYYVDKRLDEINVHGGFSYYGKAYWDDNDDRHYFGWDYAHYDDYTAWRTHRGQDGMKKYTTQEIFDEVKSVIDQLIEVENREEK